MKTKYLSMLVLALSILGVSGMSFAQNSSSLTGGAGRSFSDNFNFLCKGKSKTIKCLDPGNPDLYYLPGDSEILTTKAIARLIGKNDPDWDKNLNITPFCEVVFSFGGKKAVFGISTSIPNCKTLFENYSALNISFVLASPSSIGVTTCNKKIVAFSIDQTGPGVLIYGGTTPENTFIYCGTDFGTYGLQFDTPVFPAGLILINSDH